MELLPIIMRDLLQKALQNLDGGQIDFNCRGDGYKVTCTDGTLTYNYAGLASETYRKELL